MVVARRSETIAAKTDCRNWKQEKKRASFCKTKLKTFNKILEAIVDFSHGENQKRIE